MKKIIPFLCFLFVLCAATKAAVPELVNFKDLQGYDRQYFRYVPESYNAARPSGIIVCLHAFGQTGEDFFTTYGFQALADSMNFIVLAPNALPEQDPAVIKTMTENVPQFPLNALWGCGLNMKILVHDIPPLIAGGQPWDLTMVNCIFNAKVNDYAFINSMINATKSSYTISTDNIFMMGLSMGGFMSYQYALYYSKDLAGMISVNGSMGTNISRRNYRNSLPICDFHSVDDEVVPYAGSYDMWVPRVFNGDSIILRATVTMADSKESVITTWVGKNADRTTADSLRFDSIGNKTTALKLSYPNLTTGNDYIHYKMTGGNHAYSYSSLNGDCLDYNTEFLNFISKHITLPTGIAPIKNVDLQIFQNPAQDIIQVLGLRPIQGATIFGMDGRVVLSYKSSANTIDISSLKSGLYFVKILADGKTTVKKFIKK